MHDSDLADPVSPALLDLLALFEGPLADVQFPGVDQGTLRGLVDQVRGHAQELDQMRAQLDALHNHLTEARLRLLRTAEQGLAYARVFAADETIGVPPQLPADDQFPFGPLPVHVYVVWAAAGAIVPMAASAASANRIMNPSDDRTRARSGFTGKMRYR